MQNQPITFKTIWDKLSESFLINLVLVFLLSVIPYVACLAQDSSTKAIQVSSNGRYLISENGKPFFWLGDTEWELFNLFTVSDAETFLMKRKDQGFNVIQVMARGGFPDWSPQEKLKTMQGAQAWVNNNPQTPNENYFTRMDSIVSIAEKLNLLLVVGVYHARDVDNRWITDQNAKPWAKWLAQRYKNAKNIVWSMYPHAEQESVPIIQATVQGIIEGDAGSHIITMHPDPSPRSSSFMHSEEWLSFNTLQSWSNSILNFDMVRADYKKIPLKPVINGEARYEKEDGTKPIDIRHSAYWSYLAGGFYTYGHEGNWRYQRTWRDWFNAAGALQMKVLKDVFESVDWWNLIPDQSVFVDDASDNVAAISANRNWIMLYLPGADSITLKMDKIKTSKSAVAWWINPVNGTRTKIGIFPTSGTHTFSSPKNWEDAILLLEKQ